MLKKILLAVLGLFVIIQFFRPEKNLSNDKTYAIESKYAVPDNVDKLLQAACYDCHSNLTVYPWYAEVQPVAWWIADHVEEGKEELNFSAFTNLPLAVQHHKLDEVIEVLEEGEMPLESYTYLGMHPEANLTNNQKEILMGWAKDQMAYLKANYPADSLKMKRGKRENEEHERSESHERDDD